jgi:hypothetical protein
MIRHASSCSGLERRAEQLEPVADQAKAELARHGLLQALDLLVLELDHLAGLHVDEVIVMAVPGRLIARAAVAELMALKNAGAFEQAHGAVHGGERNAGIAGTRPAINLLDIGVVVRLRQHLGDHPALTGHAHPPLGAEALDPAFP